MRNSNLIQMGRVKRDLSVHGHAANYLLSPTSECSFSRRKMWHTSFCSMKTFHTEKNIKQDRICLRLWAVPWPGLQTQLNVSKSSNLVWDTRQRISFGSVHKLVYSHDSLTFTFVFKDMNKCWWSILVYTGHGRCNKTLWIYLTYSSGREPIERVCRGEAKLGKWWTNLLSITLKWTD